MSLRPYIDGFSITAILGSLAGVLPPLAALVSLVWGLIRIYETKTVQGWLVRRGGGDRRKP